MWTEAMRHSGRQNDELRPVSIETGVNKHAEGSCLVKCGDTHVICAASLDERVPRFRQNSGLGWVTAEYGMLPRATTKRNRREASVGSQSGRTQEIQRLIGRSLRSVTDMAALGERQITVDCDVIQADGGTRCASITGGWVALWIAAGTLVKAGKLGENPVRDHVAAVSCGIVGDSLLLDLDFAEDYEAGTDANFVMTGGGQLVETQATAEGAPFTREQHSGLLDLAEKGARELVELQARAISG